LLGRLTKGKNRNLLGKFSSVSKQKNEEDLGMEFCTVRKDQEIYADGVIYDKCSEFDHLHEL